MGEEFPSLEETWSVKIWDIEGRHLLRREGEERQGMDCMRGDWEGNSEQNIKGISKKNFNLKRKFYCGTYTQ